MGRFRVIGGDLSDRILGYWRGCWSACVASLNAPYVGSMFVLFGNWGETWIGSCLRGWDCFRGDCFSPIWQGLASMLLGLEGGDVRSQRY